MATPIILGIRRKVKTDMNARYTLVFTRHLLQYLQIFAFLGFIFAILIVADYVMPRKLQTKTITEKAKQRWTNYLYADDIYFAVDQVAYENLPKGSDLILKYTLIFKTLMEISGTDGVHTYISRPFNIYSWTMGLVIVSFILSGFLLWQNTPTTKCNHDLLVTIGLLNSFTCLFMFAFLFFPANSL
jgi:hypothetical protein